MSDQLVVANVAVRNPAGQILILRRSKTHPRLPLMWDLPGGIVEDGEDPIEAARREALEETGLVIENLAKFGERATQKAGRNHRYVLFTATTSENDVRLSYEHDKYLWVRKTDLEALDLPERMKVALERLTAPEGAEGALNSEADDGTDNKRE